MNSSGQGASKDFADLKTEVIDTGLCTRCGTCVGICPEGALAFTDFLGACLPEQVGDCTGCGLCYQACSGQEVNFPEINARMFGRQPGNVLLGNYRHICVGYAAESSTRSRGASGGVISAILTYLLEQGRINGAVVLGMDSDKPWCGKVQIARTPEEIMAAAQSKYSLSPVNTILRQLVEERGNFAYVGLPCQVHSLRKLQALGHPASDKITYVIGSYCGNILHFDAVRSFLHSNGIDEIEQIASLQYRAGEWPGHLRVELHNGKVFALKKFYANYLIPFFMVDRCRLCVDLANEFADIACGDAWAPIYEERGLGWSLVLGRTEKGTALLAEMVAGSKLELQEIAEEEAVRMHSHMLDFKKRGAFLRIGRRRRLNHAVPEYGFYPIGLPVSRRVFEWVLGGVFWVCSLSVSKRLIEHVPIRVLGLAFECMRRWWKQLTFSTKRKDLGQTRFHLKPCRDGNGK